MQNAARANVRAHDSASRRPDPWSLTRRICRQAPLRRAVSRIVWWRGAVVREALVGWADRGPTALDTCPGRLAERCYRLARQGKVGRAGQLWRQLHGVCPREPLNELVAGWLAFEASHLEEAELHYWKLLESRPGHPASRGFLAETLIFQRRWPEAQDVLDGLHRSSVRGPILGFAASLANGFELGLYRHVMASPHPAWYP